VGVLGGMVVVSATKAFVEQAAFTPWQSVCRALLRFTGKSAQKVQKVAKKPSKGVQFLPIFAKKASIFAKKSFIFAQNPFIFANFLHFFQPEPTLAAKSILHFCQVLVLSCHFYICHTLFL